MVTDWVLGNSSCLAATRASTGESNAVPRYGHQFRCPWRVVPKVKFNNSCASGISQSSRGSCSKPENLMINESQASRNASGLIESQVQHSSWRIFLLGHSEEYGADQNLRMPVRSDSSPDFESPARRSALRVPLPGDSARAAGEDFQAPRLPETQRSRPSRALRKHDDLPVAEKTDATAQGQPRLLAGLRPGGADLSGGCCTVGENSGQVRAGDASVRAPAGSRLRRLIHIFTALREQDLDAMRIREIGEQTKLPAK